MKPWKLCAVALGAPLALSPALGQHSAPWPTVLELGGAIAKGKSDWVGPGDYPSEAIRKDQQGQVIVTFDITAEGKATNCAVETSSGFPALDRVPCPLIERRARFIPAHAPDGTPIATKARCSTAFWMP